MRIPIHLVLYAYLGYVSPIIIGRTKTVPLNGMTTSKQQWQDYYKNVQQLKENALAGYPQPERGFYYNIYPPPQGSKIVPHPELAELFTMETDVEVWVVLNSFVRLNIEEQSLTLTVEEMYRWTDLSLKQDENLTYTLNSSYYQFELSERSIWTPRLQPLHTVEYGRVGGEEVLTDIMVQVHLSGENCSMRRLMVYTIPCTVNVQNFPFDEHSCVLALSQPSKLNYRMKLHPKLEERMQAKYDNYRHRLTETSTQWNLDSCQVTTRTTQHPGDPFPTDELMLNIRLRRCARFYAIVLVFPCVLLNILSLAIFALSPKDTERENFALTLILTYFVLITIVVDAIPPSGIMVPLLGLYIIMSTLVVMGTFLMSLLLKEIHQRSRVKERKMGYATLRLINNRFCIYFFTAKETQKSLIRSNQTVQLSHNDSEGREPLQMQKTRPNSLSLAMASDSLKWKVFVKFINFLFFLGTLFAHICVGVVIVLNLSPVPFSIPPILS